MTTRTRTALLPARLTLAERKAQVLGFIIDHVEERTYPPSMREIASTVGISLTRVQQVYEALVAEGVIDRKVRAARAYVVNLTAAARYVDPS